MKYEPKELTDFPGFYEIPGFDNYGINKKGIIVNRTRGSFSEGTRTPFGYYNVNLIDNKGRDVAYRRCRLVATVFHPIDGDRTKLHVNHIDGNKSNDDVDNLEWVTPKGNAMHAAAMGNIPKPLPISARNVDTGVVLKFDTLISCARHFNLTRDGMQIRTRLSEDRVWPERYQYRRSHSDAPWLIPEDIEASWKSNGTKRKVLLRNVLTDEIKEFDKMLELSNFLNISPSCITEWIKKPGQVVIIAPDKNYYQAQKEIDLKPWREVTDVYAELQKEPGRQVVKAINAATKEETIYLTVADCARAQDLLITTLCNRLKSNGQTVYSDGYTYEYYSIN